MQDLQGEDNSQWCQSSGSLILDTLCSLPILEHLGSSFQGSQYIFFDSIVDFCVATATTIIINFPMC